MLHKRKAAGLPAPEPKGAEAAAAVLPSPTPANPAAAAAAEAPKEKPKAGPGRPPSRPHCLKCGRRVEKCRCKDGSLLPAEVVAAAEEKKRAETPFTAEDAEQIVRIFCWLAGIGESAAAALLARVPLGKAEEIFSFSEEDIRQLVPPAHRVLAKYIARLPAWFRDNRDEFALCMALYNVHRPKLDRLAELRAEQEKSRRPSVPPPAHAAPLELVERTRAAASGSTAP